MGRWPMALALGLFWAQAVSAQPHQLGEDYAPIDPVFQERHILFGDMEARRQEAEEFAALMIDAIDVHRRGGKSVDASCLEEVMHHKGLLTWQGLFTNFSTSCVYTIEPLRFPDGCPCLEILNYLCFFDVLSPAKVGPEMRWTFKVPEPATRPSLDEADAGFVCDDNRLVEWAKSVAPVFIAGPGANTDSSCLEEVKHNSALFTWQGLFADGSQLDRYQPVQAVYFRDGSPCLEILNHLCFFDVLAPAKVGPEMGPSFTEPEPLPSPSGCFCSSYFH